MQETDGKGLDVFFAKSPDNFSHLVFVELRQHLPRRVEPLRNTDTERPRHKRLRLVTKNVVQPRPNLTTDLEDIAKSLGGDQRCFRALTLDDRIRRNGGTVNNRRDIHSRHVRFTKRAFGNVHEANGRVARRARHFYEAYLARVLVHHDQIGEGASGINAQAVLSHGAQRLSFRSINRKT